MKLDPAITRKFAITLVGFAFLTALFYLRILSREFTLFGYFDNRIQFYAWFQYAARSIHSGILPLWDPMQFAGHSFIGEAQTGLFYPLNLLFVSIFGSKAGVPLYALEGSLMVGSFIAAVSMFYCCRKLGLEQLPALVASIIFAFGGFLGTRMVGQAGLFNAAVWLPLVFLLFLRASEEENFLRSLFWSALTGAVLAVSLLAGHIQPLLHMYLLLIFYAGYKLLTSGDVSHDRISRSLAQLAMVAMMIVLIGGVQLFPSLEYSSQAVRWVGGEVPTNPGDRVPHAVLDEFQLQPLGVLGFLFPGLFPAQDGTPYFGVLSIVLFAIGLFVLRKKISVFFYSVAFVSLLYALGTFTIVHDIFFYTVPFVEKIREPIRALFIFHFAAAIIGGYAIQLIYNGMPEDTKKAVVRIVTLLIFVGVAFFVLAAALGIYFKFGLQTMRSGFLNPIFRFSLFLMGCSLLVRMFLQDQLSRRTFAVLACALLVLDVFSVSGASFSLSGAANAPTQLYASNTIVDFLKKDSSFFRVDLQENTLPPNVGDVAGIQCLMGHGASMEASFWRFRNECWFPDDPLYSLLNVKYVVTRDDIAKGKKVLDGDIKVYQLDALPRIWHAERVVYLANDAEAYRKMRSPGFDLKKDVVVHTSLPMPMGKAPTDVRYSITSYGPNRITIACTTDAPALLIMSEKFYPGWRCIVNGKASEIIRADGIFRAFVVPAGSSETILTYQPGSFRLGLWTLGFGALLLVVLGAVSRKK